MVRALHLRRSNHPIPVRPGGVVLCLLAGILSPADAQPPSFRSRVDYVLLDVSVTTNKGVPVAGLTVENFEVKDQGRVQQIERLESGTTNVAVMLVADFSASMKPRQYALARGVAALAELLEPGDDARLLVFNETPTLLEQAEPEQWGSAVLARAPTGQTALYDAMRLAIREFATLPDQRRVMIVLSDGADTASFSSRSELFDALRSSGALVYSVGLFDPGEPNTDAGLLRNIAERSGGLAFFDRDASTLATVFDDIMRDLRARYVLMFRAAPAEQDKQQVRKVALTVRDAEGQRLRVRSRREYSISALQSPVPESSPSPLPETPPALPDR